jgi:predicted SnoaL-like aldol condensation-catalyzing enzyme
VTVLTSGDIVGVVFRYDDPRKPGGKYTTIWYDQWRIVDGRADEHWDTAMLAQQ